MTLEEAQRRVEEFLTRQMLDALGALEYALPRFDTEPQEVTLTEAARARVELRHVRGASDCAYIVGAFGDELLVQLQLNVHRLVVVYRVPAQAGLDAAAVEPRLQRWRIGAEHAGWTVGHRDAQSPHDPAERWVETYCYAFAGRDFLEDPLQQLFWRTDIVQMSRALLLELQRAGFVLSPRRAGFRV
jgi:hypothetical protein